MAIVLLRFRRRQRWSPILMDRQKLRVIVDTIYVGARGELAPRLHESGNIEEVLLCGSPILLPVWLPHATANRQFQGNHRICVTL